MNKQQQTKAQPKKHIKHWKQCAKEKWTKNNVCIIGVRRRSSTRLQSVEENKRQKLEKSVKQSYRSFRSENEVREKYALLKPG